MKRPKGAIIPQPKGFTKLHSLKISENQADGLKLVIEEKLKGLHEQLATVEPDFRQAEAIYLEYKTKYDEANYLIENYKQTLSTLSNLNKGFPVSKEIKAIRRESHTNAPEKKYFGTSDWKQYLKVYLEQKRMFLDIAHVHEALIKRHQIPKIGGTYFSDFMKICLAEHKAFDKHREIVKRGNEINIGLVIYQNKVGLHSWVDKNLRPKPEFIADIIKQN